MKMNKKTALRLLKDIEMISETELEINHEKFLTILKNYVEVEE